ncbi:MAG: hypothetical protein AAFV07_21285, partial [Bacteroidota bacterium]
GFVGEGRNFSGNTGLQFLCNTNLNNTDNDITAVEWSFELDPVNFQYHGIRFHQGTPGTSTAGNVFSAQTNNTTDGHLGNGTQNFYIYHAFDAPTLEPQLYNPATVAITVTQTPDGCGTSTGGGMNGDPLPPSEQSELVVLYDSAELAYTNVLHSYQQLIDGGSTSQMLSQIQGSWSDEAWTLRNALIAESPYLSTEALIGAAMEGVLPHAMLLEVCLANPEATREEGFISILETEIPNPLPGYMLDMIVANWSARTPRSTLEENMAYWSHLYHRTSNALIRDLSADSLSQTDAVRYWLRRRAGLSDQYLMAASYWEDKRFDSALHVLNAIPGQHDLSRTGLQEAHTQFVAL